MMKPILALLVFAGLLAACGARVPLVPKPGSILPLKGEESPSRPSAEQLITPDTQARPKRSDEQLRRSEERRDDRFDLPPA